MQAVDHDLRLVAGKGTATGSGHGRDVDDNLRYCQ